MSNLKRTNSVCMACFLFLGGVLGCSMLVERTVKTPAPKVKIETEKPLPQTSNSSRDDASQAQVTLLPQNGSVPFGDMADQRLDRQARELSSHVLARRTEHGILAELRCDSLFEAGQTELKPQGLIHVAKIAEIIRKYPENRLRIVGHTDSGGDAQNNAEVSRKRAEAIKRKLAESGVPGDVITTYGMGDTQPIAANSTDEGRKRNRRLEIEITIDRSSLPKKSAGFNQ